MAQVCDICNRGTRTSFNVSHSKVKTKKTQQINIQSKKIGAKRKKVCTSCLKNINKKAR